MKQKVIDAFEQSGEIAKIIFIRNVKDVLLIVLGVLMASIGLKAFLLPNLFLDGGAMGMSLLLNKVTNVDLSVLILVVNLPFLIFGSQQISIRFALKSVVAIVGLSLLVHFLEFPALTNDKLLISVFGGFFLGSGIGFTIRGGAVIDGAEVLAIRISAKSSLTIGDFISIFNVTLFLIATAVVPLETAMYSMLTYLSASKAADFIIHGIDEYIGVLIISKHSQEIKESILQNLNAGVPVFKGGGGFSSSEKEILFCVITRLEITQLILEIQKIDKSAFIVQHTVQDTKGGMIKKRSVH